MPWNENAAFRAALDVAQFASLLQASQRAGYEVFEMTPQQSGTTWHTRCKGVEFGFGTDDRTDAETLCVRTFTIDCPLKFVVFAYDSCYPAGGMNDIVASFDALETAIAFLDICKPEGAHIVDKTSFAIVHEL